MWRDPEAEPMTRSDWVKTGIIVAFMLFCALVWLTAGRIL